MQIHNLEEKYQDISRNIRQIHQDFQKKCPDLSRNFCRIQLEGVFLEISTKYCQNISEISRKTFRNLSRNACININQIYLNISIYIYNVYLSYSMKILRMLKIKNLKINDLGVYLSSTDPCTDLKEGLRRRDDIRELREPGTDSSHCSSSSCHQSSSNQSSCSEQSIEILPVNHSIAIKTGTLRQIIVIIIIMIIIIVIEIIIIILIEK